MNNSATQWAKWVLARPWSLIILSIVIVMMAASGARFLSVTNDYRVFFRADNPQRIAHENLQSSYTKDDNILIVLQPKNGKVFVPANLHAIRQLTEAAWKVPHSLRVDSITNFQHSYAQGDDLFVGDLVPKKGSISYSQAAKIKNIAINEPLLRDALISPKGDVTGVNITLQINGGNASEKQLEAVQYAKKIKQEFIENYSNFNVYMTGSIMLNNAFREASQNDMSNLLPITLLIIVISIGFLLRGWTGTVATFSVIMLSIMAGMGMAGWYGILITPPLGSAPVIILTLAVANAVHILVTYFQQLRKGDSKYSAMHESLRVNLLPVFLTSLTTSVGFLSMNFSDSPPFADLGNVVATGVAFSFLLSTVFLPALMLILPRGRYAQNNKVSGFNKLGSWVVEKRRSLLIIMGAFIIALTSMIPKNELNDEWVSYFDRSVEFRQDTDFASQNLTGVYRIEYSLDSKIANGVSDPDYLKKVDAFNQWYRKQDGVIHVNSVTDIFKRLNMNMHGDNNSFYRLPDDKGLAAQYLLLYEMSLPYGLDLNNQINVDKSATRTTVSLDNMSIKQLLALEEKAQAWLAHNAPELQTNGAGTSIMFAHIGRNNINSMLIGTTLALVIISIILAFALRSVKLGGISLIPNLVPAAMGFGLWGMISGEVGLGLSVVVGMTLGIVVDDTVHFLSKYLRAKREHGLDSEQAIKYAFNTVGTALWFTSLVLVAGFAVLALSTFRLNADMGLLTAITIAIALIIDFLFLPPLLMLLDGDKKKTADAFDATADLEPSTEQA